MSSRRTAKGLDEEDRAYRAAHPPLTPQEIEARAMEHARVSVSHWISEIDHAIRLLPGVFTHGLVAQLRKTLAHAERDAGTAPPGETPAE